jgi:hypothetical protein
MITVRIRSLGWLTMGVALALVVVWSFAAWRADAAPGPDESTFVPVAPVRVLDTRDPLNVGLAGPLVSAVSQDLQVTGNIPTTSGTQLVVPPLATAVALSVTVVSPTASGFISIRPADAVGAPATSSLNFLSGETVPNAVEVQLPITGTAAGMIEITYDAYGTPGPTADVLIDVVGYNTSSGLQELVANVAAKANTADVYTKAEIDASPANSLLAMGQIKPDGSTVGAYTSFGAYTTSRTSVGQYEITFAGLSAGCAVDWPLVLVSPFALDRIPTAFGGVTNCGTGATRLFVHVRNSAGAYADSAFNFVIYRTPSTELLPFEVAAHPDGVVCRSEPDLTNVCE